MDVSGLISRRCRPVAGTPALDRAAADELLAQIPGWTADARAASISRRFVFRSYHETIAFVNAVAWIAHHEDHHPDLEVGYDHCTVRYATHDVGGLSENDFICAAKVDALVP